MKVEARRNTADSRLSQLVLISESEEESKAIDLILGSRIGQDGWIADVRGQVRLADGFREHYITLKPVRVVEGEE